MVAAPSRLPATARTAAPHDPTGIPASVAVPASPAVEPFHDAFPGDTYSPAAAAARAHRLLSFLALPHTTTSGRPSAALLPAPRSDARRNLVIRSRFVSVPGSVTTLRAFLSAQVPWDARWITPTRYLVHPDDSRATIVVTLVQQHGRVAVRIDGEDIWLPHRSPGEFIPWSMRVVELARTPLAGEGTPQRLLFRGGEVEKVAALLNWATPRPPAPCPAGHPTARTRVTFRIGHRVVTFRWTDDGCDIIKVVVNGRPATSLTGRVYTARFVDYLLTGKAH